MMEVQMNEIINVDRSSCVDLKDNAVQDILNECEKVDIESSQVTDLCRYLPHNENISELTENLIITSASNVSPLTLKMFNISCIVSCAPELPDLPVCEEITYHKIDVIDSGFSEILPYFDPTADLIHQVSNLGGRTLVYCVAGVSRSASICIAYLMKYHKLSLYEAYNYVKVRRSRIKPNCGFFKQLIEYEKQLFKSSTIQMVFNEFVHMEIPDVYDSEYRVVCYRSRIHRKNGRY